MFKGFFYNFCDVPIRILVIILSLPQNSCQNSGKSALMIDLWLHTLRLPLAWRLAITTWRVASVWYRLIIDIRTTQLTWSNVMQRISTLILSDDGYTVTTLFNSKLTLSRAARPFIARASACQPVDSAISWIWLLDFHWLHSHTLAMASIPSLNAPPISMRSSEIFYRLHHFYVPNMRLTCLTITKSFMRLFWITQTSNRALTYGQAAEILIPFTRWSK